MIYTSQTGALNTNAAIKPSGTAKHHIAPIFPFISNFASPPAQNIPSRTVVFTDCPIRLMPRTISIKPRYPFAVSDIGAARDTTGATTIRSRPVIIPMAIDSLVILPPYFLALSSLPAPRRLPIIIPAPAPRRFHSTDGRDRMRSGA